MKNRILVPFTLFLTILAWMVLSWPLPLHMTTAISISAHHGADKQILHMVPGDSLQFLYYFELVRDWFSGGTPWFYNLYEFNTGDDSERYLPGGYYAPFSLFYTLGAALAGPAFGMNVTGLLSLWLTMLATWFLLRRYVHDEWIVGLFSVFVLFFPYRWTVLYEGSPTGLAMMLVPFLILGLDMAVREGRLLGGVIAGMAIILAYTSDLHVFFFSVLITPAWCFLALVAQPMSTRPLRSRLLQSAKAFLPMALAAILVFLVVQVESASLQETHMGEGRNIGEVRLFSPTKDGFFTWQGGGIRGQAYLGWTAPALVLIGLGVMFRAFFRRPREYFRPTFFMVTLCLGICLAAILALGPNGLRSGGLFMLIRELIPPYAMIRQAGKIYCLMPTLLAVAGSLSLAALVRTGLKNNWRRGFCLLIVAVPMLTEYARLSSLELTYLQTRQPAYEAVAEDARARDEVSRALVIPLWPGDSHYASLYQYFALMYRIRMVNGYTPAVSTSYFENIFLAFESVNQGFLSTKQINELLSRGIRHILLHEDLYPEKVAPFPVTYAIRQYLDHPQLQFLERADSVWAFRILERPTESDRGYLAQAVEQRMPFFPARHWEMERSVLEKAKILAASSASENTYVTLDEEGAGLRLSSSGAPPAPRLRFMIRSRGRGLIGAEIFSGDELLEDAVMNVDQPDWAWLQLPVRIGDFSNLSLRLRRLDGHIDLDSAMLVAGTWSILQVGESMTIPAAYFFHAGYSDHQQHQVVFLKKYYENRVVLYGPRMPMEPGRYEISIVYAADAEHGVELGTLLIETGRNPEVERRLTLAQGGPIRFQLRLENNLPLNMDLVFSGQADMIVDSVEITRLE